MFEILYQYLSDWWNSESPPMTVTNSKPVSSNIGRFVEFVKKRHPDIEKEKLKDVRSKYFKIHRQLVVNPEFRGKSFDWTFLANKLISSEENNQHLLSTMTEQTLMKNIELWNAIAPITFPNREIVF